MVPLRFCKKVVLAGFVAEAQAPMVIADKTELSTTVPTAVLQFSHGALLRFARVSTAANFVAWSNFNSVSAVHLIATPRCAGGQVSALHCQEIAAELTFRN
jgi:hypothetical protein